MYHQKIAVRNGKGIRNAAGPGACFKDSRPPMVSCSNTMENRSLLTARGQNAPPVSKDFMATYSAWYFVTQYNERKYGAAITQIIGLIAEYTVQIVTTNKVFAISWS
jgi:hypothetical protein